MALASVAEVGEELGGQGYLADEALAIAVFLAAEIEQPLLLEGEAGVGKTEVAEAVAAATGARLIRLQCHEGIDLHQALYDWDWGRQLLALRAGSGDVELFSERFLLRRPLLEALEHPGPVVLLVDEIDRADDEFEAFLLEVLSEYSVSVPELGTLRAPVPPVVVLTSNRTRELHDALKRRCFYHWLDHPAFAREVEIVRVRLPHVSEQLARQVTAAVQALRREDLLKPPGVAETLDWAAALTVLGAERLDADLVARTLGSVLKYREDQQRAASLDLQAVLTGA